jgi:multimeric flavodoxin WrbA
MSASTPQEAASKPTVIAFNGGPRRHWNTATLLRQALEGAAAVGAETRWVDLYETDFKGCRSCFACKTRGGRSYGRCALRDGLTPSLESLEQVEAILIGSPIYLGSVTGETRSFLERLLFPFYTYTDPPQSLFPKPIRVGVIYTMGAPEERVEQLGYWNHLGLTEFFLELVLGKVERLASFDTLQFDDYGKVVADRFDPVHKAQRRQEVFPLDCQKARDLGARLVTAPG